MGYTLKKKAVVVLLILSITGFARPQVAQAALTGVLGCAPSNFFARIGSAIFDRYFEKIVIDVLIAMATYGAGLAYEGVGEGFLAGIDAADAAAGAAMTSNLAGQTLAQQAAAYATAEAAVQGGVQAGSSILEAAVYEATSNTAVGLLSAAEAQAFGTVVGTAAAGPGGLLGAQVTANIFMDNVARVGAEEAAKAALAGASAYNLTFVETGLATYAEADAKEMAQLYINQALRQQTVGSVIESGLEQAAFDAAAAQVGAEFAQAGQYYQEMTSKLVDAGNDLTRLIAQRDELKSQISQLQGANLVSQTNALGAELDNTLGLIRQAETDVGLASIKQRLAAEAFDVAISGESIPVVSGAVGTAGSTGVAGELLSYPDTFNLVSAKQIGGTEVAATFGNPVNGYYTTATIEGKVIQIGVGSEGTLAESALEKAVQEGLVEEGPTGLVPVGATARVIKYPGELKFLAGGTQVATSDSYNFLYTVSGTNASVITTPDVVGTVVPIGVVAPSVPPSTIPLGVAAPTAPVPTFGVAAAITAPIDASWVAPTVGIVACSAGLLCPKGISSSGATVTLLSSTDVGCHYRNMPVTFHIPQFNATYHKTSFQYVTDDDTGYPWSIDSEGNHIRPIPPDHRYLDASCTIPDPDGGFGKVDVWYNGSELVPARCDPLQIKSFACEVDSAAKIDENSEIAVYRFVKSKPATSPELKEWIFSDIQAHVGSGYSNVTMGEYIDRWSMKTGEDECDAWVGIKGPNTESKPYFLASYETRICSGTECHKFCTGSTCTFYDPDVPNNSYVAYVAKVINNYTSQQTADWEFDVGPEGDTYGGHAVTTYSCSPTLPNKFLNKDGADTTLLTLNEGVQNAIVGPFETGEAVCTEPVSCGPTHYTCSDKSEGTDQTYDSATYRYTWKCPSDSSGKTTISCLEDEKFDGVCSKDFIGMCLPGRPNDFKFTGVSGSFSWTCKGINGGKDASCLSTLPTGFITPKSCEIPVDKGSCEIKVHWESSSTIGTVFVLRNYDNGSVFASGKTGTEMATFPSGSWKLDLVDYDDVHNKKNVLASSTFTANCTTGSTWYESVGKCLSSPPAGNDGKCANPETHYNCESPAASVNRSETATEYTWSCLGATGGRTAWCMESKSGIGSSSGITASLWPDKATIAVGESTMLNWSSTGGADSCTGTGFSAGPPSGSRSTGALSATRSYSVQCSRSGVLSNTANATVTVLDPKVEISANPTRVKAGNKSTITWTGVSVKDCTISGPNLPARHDFSATPKSADAIVNMQSKYTIACTKATTAGGPISASVTVNIIPDYNEF